MTQYRYYFKKPRGEIIKDIFSWLLVGGMIAIAATSPTFLYQGLQTFHRRKKYKKQSVSNAFHRLRKEGCIDVHTHNHQLYVSLTEEGRKRAGRFQINNLQIKKPKSWDRKWRIVVFDVIDRQRIKREVLRGFLKRLGFYKLQDSVWVHPFDCKDEIVLLRDFFGFTVREVQLVIAEKIEQSDLLQKRFHL